MTGANFAVAETGSFVVCTNEGNADLSANVPKLHIASIGIEKIIPRLEHLGVFVRLLSRSALGSPITQYTSHFRGAARRAARCTSCWSTTAVRSGWAWTTSGLAQVHPLRRLHEHLPGLPAQRRPELRRHLFRPDRPRSSIRRSTCAKYSTLPFASTLNGSCTNVCPVKINIHEQIYKWRRELVRAARVAVRQEGGDEGGRQGALATRRLSRGDHRRRHARSRICRASSSTTASTPGASSARCRIRRRRPSTAGTRRTAERSNEQPRRHPGLDPREPAAGGPAAARRALVRRRPAGIAARRVQGQVCERMGGKFLDPPASGRRPGAGRARRSQAPRSCARPCRRSPATAISPASALTAGSGRRRRRHRPRRLRRRRDRLGAAHRRGVSR